MKKTYLNKTMSALKMLFAGLLVFNSLSGEAQCIANFSYTVGPNGVVNFLSTSSVSTLTPIQYNWTLGSGATGFGPMLSFTYTTNGPKSICLTVLDTANNCTDTKCDSIFINTIQTGTTTPCSKTVVYSMSKDSIQPLTWNAFPSYPANITNATWYWGDGTSTIGLYPSHTYSAAGTYSTCVTVSVSCDSLIGSYCYVANIFKSTESNAMITMNVVQSKITGIANVSKNNDLLAIYPNPSSEFFTLELSGDAKDSKELSVSVYNMLGERVLEQNISTSKQNIDVSTLSTGTYFVKVLSENGLYTKKIMVQK